MTTTTIGKTRLIFRNSENNKKYNIVFQVVKEEITPLIGMKAAEDMNIITVNYDNFRQLNSVSEKDILSEISDVIIVKLIGYSDGYSSFHNRRNCGPQGGFSKTCPRWVEREMEIETPEPGKECCYPRIFQKRLNIALEGLEGVMCVVDDIIVYGTGDDMHHATEDHDKKLR